MAKSRGTGFIVVKSAGATALASGGILTKMKEEAK